MGIPGLPDGEGVLSPKASAGKVVAFLGSYAVAIILGTIWVLTFLGMLGGEAHGSTVDRATAARIEQAIAAIDERSKATEATMGRVESELSNQGRDIAVIKRHLGLDGLGPRRP